MAIQSAMVHSARPARSGLTTAVETVALAAVATALVLLAVRLARGIHAPRDIAVMLTMLAAGYFLADAMTGTVHWFCDTFFEETTPVIGRALIAPFREHHRDPLAMTRHGLLELTGNSCLALAPLLALFLVLTPARPRVALDALVLALAGAAGATNVFHRWAHEPSPPPGVRWLHRLGIVLTPSRHAQHHKPPFAAAYCVTSGWMNAACDRLKVFSRAEAVLSSLGLPSHGSHRDQTPGERRL
jgi:plasmanylethanolamine desaturase